MKNIILLALILILVGLLLAQTAPAYACGGRFACGDSISKFLRSPNQTSMQLVLPDRTGTVLLI